jgi:peptidyl-prolyl cis-trans isomerase A (cyclophilin A)
VIRRTLLLALAAGLALPAAGAVRHPPHPAEPPVRVRLDTSAGPIVIQLEMKRAPITSRNFLAYVDQKRFDGTSFYRAARYGGTAKEGLVQGGIDHAMVRSLVPIKHEPTTITGLHHGNGTVSMARNDPGSAMGDFFIVVGDGSYLDAAPNYPGYAAFGHVVSGMDAVRHMLAAPTFPGGWTAETKGQSIIHPFRIVSARRLS